MSNVNPLALLFIAFCAVAGALAGHVLVGLLIGLGIVMAATVDA